MSEQLSTEIDRRIGAVSLRIQPELRRLQAAIVRRERRRQPTTTLQARLQQALESAETTLAARLALAPRLEYPAELPVSHARAKIMDTLQRHQVVVVCGETGSGKTTQLPKICLEAGRGRTGMIGITQPRRIAARAVAGRLAQETGLALGRGIGLKLRFTDLTESDTLVKVMTDGILLNEIRHDRLLRAYDTLIIDEAHERSLNIDFILGYLKRIRTERPDLKLIVTSATIDPERLVNYFDAAPLLRVEGRHFPIEMRYRPPDRDSEWLRALDLAVAELSAVPIDSADTLGRDILVFLPGERWIRDAERELRRRWATRYEILPLYARLSAAQQDRIFRPGPKPRIVLATNVAETSLTVPRVRFVIDSGLARISRYAPRQRLRGLAVERIARANAAQRAGRCGRVGPGICIRLYPEQDFAERAEFSDPEIMRADLAGVILRLEALGLGHIDAFPFLDAPPAAAIKDAYRLLEMLTALDADRRLTAHGAELARLPLEPRLGRLLGVAHAEGALSEGLVIAAALSVPDPREDRGGSAPGSASEAHDEAMPTDRESDFMALLALWRQFKAQRSKGWPQLREWCQSRGLALVRLVEWEDVHRQLAELVAELNWRPNRAAASYKSIHMAVLAAFVDQIAEHEQGSAYRGVQGTTAVLAPGTAVARKAPRWIVAAERYATERVYLRMVARINPRWIVEVAPQLIRRRYENPYWDPARGQVLANEIVQWNDLVLSRQGKVDYGRVAPSEARAIFIAEALTAGQLGVELDWLERNQALQASVLDWEARLRARDLARAEQDLSEWYAQRLPQAVRDRASLLSWSRRGERVEALLWSLSDIMTRPLPDGAAADYPDLLQLGAYALPVRYRFDPADPADGLTLTLPDLLLQVLRAEDADWLIPGWTAQKAVALLRTLPKERRRALVPMPDTLATLLPALRARRSGEDMVMALCRLLHEQRGIQLRPAEFKRESLPPFLELRIEVVAAGGGVLAVERDLIALQRRFAGAAVAASPGDEPGQTRRRVASWNFDDLPPTQAYRGNPDLRVYPALIECDGQVELGSVPLGPAAAATHRKGVRRLLLKALPQQQDWLRRRISEDRELLLHYHGIGTLESLLDDLACAAADESFALDPPVRTRRDFAAVLAQGRAQFIPAAQQLQSLMRDIAQRYRSLRRALADAASLDSEALADITGQIERLVYAGCLRDTPVEWRRHLPRYLLAAERRLESLRHGARKDAEYRSHLLRAEAPLAAWRKSLPQGWPWPAPILRYRWLLEEFRVSLFAQSLGTAERVSARRLEEVWKQAQTELR